MFLCERLEHNDGVRGLCDYCDVCELDEPRYCELDFDEILFEGEQEYWEWFRVNYDDELGCDDFDCDVEVYFDDCPF